MLSLDARSRLAAPDADLADGSTRLKSQTVKGVELADADADADADATHYSPQIYAQQLAVLEEEYQTLKTGLLRAGNHAALRIRPMMQQMDLISAMLCAASPGTAAGERRAVPAQFT